MNLVGLMRIGSHNALSDVRRTNVMRYEHADHTDPLSNMLVGIVPTCGRAREFEHEHV